MTWNDVRDAYPHQWVLVEALQAHTESDRRLLDNVEVIGAFPDSLTAWKVYTEMHGEAPFRELYPLHTGQEVPDIRERPGPVLRGIRRAIGRQEIRSGRTRR